MTSPTGSRDRGEVRCARFELTRRSVSPSSLSPLGPVRHLADVERRWFRVALAGHDIELRYCSPELSRTTSTAPIREP
ncbi:DUF664 domain-containing protein [Streptomyces sp. NPDC008150]|uniref:mycothiol transferase n=1 Tax=Streptomyces sp. NPDC008150 TaxID=3364816 RepID=UPI0036EBFBBC